MMFDSPPQQTTRHEVCTDETDRSSWHWKIVGIHDYWRSISPSNGLPGRQHFDPVDIPRLLSSICILDVIGNPRRYKYRLFGTGIVMAYGFEPTGQFFDAVYEKSDQLGPILDRFDRIVDQGIVTRGKFEMTLIARKDHIQVEVINMPLAADGLHVDQILSGFVFTDRSGREIR